MKLIKLFVFLLTLTLILASCTKDESVVFLPYSGIVNGGFEYGNLSGWDSGGDARALELLDTLQAFEGSYMALLSTGLDPDFNHGIITQTFRIKEDFEFLSFRCNMVFEEFLTQMHEVQQDFFRVSLIRGNGSEQMILHGNAYLAANQSGAMTNPPGNMIRISNEILPDAYMTGWKEMVFNVSEYLGEEVTLRFEVLRATGGNFRIVVLVDSLNLFRNPD